MKCKTLLVLGILYLLTVPRPPAVLAQDISGTFEAEINDWDDEDRLQIQFRTRGRHNWGTGFSFDDIRGLSAGDRETDQPVEFSLEREAGRIDFQGEWVARRAIEGDFQFTADDEYAEAMKELGHRRLRDKDLMAAVVFDITTAFAGALDKRGYDPDWDDLTAMRIHGATIEFIDEMADAGFDDVDLDNLVAFRIHGVTADFARALREFGGRRVGEEDLIAARIHGVTPEFAEELRELGYDRVRLDDLVSMRIHGVTTGFIQEMNEVGYANVDVDELVACRIHGVDAEFAEDVHRDGYEDASLQDLIEMRIHGGRWARRGRHH